MPKARPMRITTGVVLWLAAAAAATTVGIVAVSAIGTDIFGASTQRPLTQSEVDRQLSETTTPPATTTTPPPSSTAPTTTPPSTQPAGKPKVVRSAGGTVLARCVPGGVEVVGASPAQGYGVDSENEGIDDHPHVRFRSGDQEVEVRLRCVGGKIQPEIRSK